MARWKLTEAHYLNGRPPDLDEVEWEYKEIDRISGREKRKRFKVPFYFEEGTIVCMEGQGQDGDSIFEGKPTPSMQPLDAEAKRISALYESEWKLPMSEEALPGQGYGDAIARSFDKQIEKLLSLKAPTPVATSGVSREEFDQLREQLAQVLARNAELEATPAPKSKISANRKVA